MATRKKKPTRKPSTLQTRLANLEALVEQQRDFIGDCIQRLGVVDNERRELLAVQSKQTFDLERLADGVGPLWKMLDGTVLPMRLMSDNHIENALRMSLSPIVRAELLAEQRRRKQDDEWHQNSGKMSPRQTLATLRQDMRLQCQELARRIEQQGGIFDELRRDIREKTDPLRVLGLSPSQLHTLRKLAVSNDHAPFARGGPVGRVYNQPCQFDFGAIEHNLLARTEQRSKAKDQLERAITALFEMRGPAHGRFGLDEVIEALREVSRVL